MEVNLDFAAQCHILTCSCILVRQVRLCLQLESDEGLLRAVDTLFGTKQQLLSCAKTKQSKFHTQ